MTLTYIPAYFYLDWGADYWLENIPAFLSAHYNQLTQELRLAGEAGENLRWLTGLYAYRVANSGDFIAGGFPLAQVSENRLEGWAVFGEATYEFSDTLRLVAGGRLSQDHREGEGQTAFGQTYTADEDYDQFDWKWVSKWTSQRPRWCTPRSRPGISRARITCSRRRRSSRTWCGRRR